MNATNNVPIGAWRLCIVLQYARRFAVRMQISLFAVLCLAWTSSVSAQADRVILISIDGLRAEDSAQLGALQAVTPNLERLLREGIRAEGVIPTAPANTFPNHVTMVTGVSAATHGVLDNDIFAPGAPVHGLFYHYASDVAVPTLFDAAREAGKRTMAIWWPVTTGAYIDSLLADVPGHVAERGKYVFGSATPEIREALGNPDRAGSMTDEIRLETAIAGLSTRPDFMAIHFTELDSAQHTYGAGSPEAMQALAATDERLGRFLDALDVAGLRQGSAIAIVSDHGFAPLHSAISPGRLFRSMGLLDIDEDGDVTEWDAYPWPGGGALVIYVNPETEDPAAVRASVDRLIAFMRAHPADFVKDVYRGEAMAQWGGYPDAYAIINARQGFAFSGDLDAELLRSGTRTRGTHGFLADGPYMYGSLILSGEGVSASGNLGVVRMEDIAPTLAALMGLSLPEAEGQVLNEALE